MELTLKRLLEHTEFKKYRGKGYDPTEVDDFLARAAAMAGKVEVQLTQALEQARAAGSSASPADVEAEVERRVAERLAQQPAPTGPSEDDIAEEARRTLALAQRTADAAVREAREDAEKILAAAKEQAEHLVADAEADATARRAETDAWVSTTRAEVEAEAAHDRREARQRLATEIGELEGLRESLRSDVNILERHVEDQRSQLGSTLAELQQILDDPSGFRMAPVPALADPALPDFSDLAELVVAEHDAVAAADAVAAPDAAAAPEGPAPVLVDDAPADESDPPVVDEPAAPASAEASADADADAEADADRGEEPPPAPTLPPPGVYGRIPDQISDPVDAVAPAPPALAYDEVDHAAPGLDDGLDAGPPTAPVSPVELGVAGGDDDAFLAELRKAMADDEPLGPRDTDEHPPSDTLFEDDDRRGWRFGRRR